MIKSVVRAEAAKRALRKYGDKEKARLLKRYFKTGPGEYAEGDVFIGVNVPIVRKLAKRFEDLGLAENVRLLKSSIHEERLLSLLIFVSKFSRSDNDRKKEIYDIYLKHTGYINNWDLVDVTAKRIVGAYLMDKNKSPLYRLARSRSVWERRISILSTFHFIDRREFSDALKIAEMLLSDRQDLIHKAVGWMLREVGKKDVAAEEGFLQKHCAIMPRTMLRYAIERFPERKRRGYLINRYITGGIK